MSRAAGWRWLIAGALIAQFSASASSSRGADPAPTIVTAEPWPAESPARWRAERRIIDLHLHVEANPDRIERALRILNDSGVGIGLNLGAGVTTSRDGQPSEFEVTKRRFDEAAPGRFMQSMILDYSGWDEPEWSNGAVRQIEIGHALGAAGLKEFKRLGLFLRDRDGKLLRVDDPKLDPVWKRCGELQMPVSIHVGDPRAFWLPYDETNERWKELKDHRSWWFGDPQRYPPRHELLEALNRVVARHPGTTFIGVHFANNPEELDWVRRTLDQYPNFHADLAARIPELGRHDPAAVRKLFEDHQDRILFATDFMVYNKLILGSGGDAENPTDDDGREFFRKCWRWLETNDRDWPHMTPIQGDWTISSIGLSPAVLRKVYFDNARRLFARSLPLPTITAAHIDRDFAPDGKFAEPEWQQATPVYLEYQSKTSRAVPELSTEVRLLWSDRYLYLGYTAPYTELSVFTDTVVGERIGLWERDVVEAFIGTDPEHPQRYTEFEWAPNGESLDLRLDRPHSDFAWTAHGESAVHIDAAAKRWFVEARIPLAALAETPPQAGTRWRINLFRHDRTHQAGLAFSPTLRNTFHAPDRFGWLEFAR